MKQIIRLLLLLLITTQIIFASVRAKVDNSSVELGEMVTYSLNISGEDIKRPNIQRLCDTDVISTASQTNMQIVNGNITRSYTLSYRFVPLKSCEIKPIEVEVNSKSELSNSVKVEVKPISQTKDADFLITLQVDKKELFVGETFNLTYVLKQKTNSHAVDSEFIAPDLKGFWVKSKSEQTTYKEGQYTITKVVNKLSAQRDGKSLINRARMRIASRGSTTDGWGAWVSEIKWKTYFSNEIELDVKPLPAGVSLVGDFDISVEVDKKEIEANEAVNVTIKVVGEGNLEDIKSFKPTIEGVSVFDEKISLKSNNELTQKIAFVAERDFSIAPFSIKYFNPQTKEIKTIKTDAIDIKVNHAKQKEELVIKRDVQVNDELDKRPVIGYGTITLVVVFMVGLIIGVLIMFIKPLRFAKKERAVSIKEPKVLLMKLLPHKENDDVKNIVDILEKNIYEGQNLVIDKKALKEIIKRYELD